MKRQSQQSNFPDGCVGYAVGDIHGRADLLARMLDRLERDALAAKAKRSIVVFLGDYVDRGVDSAEVISLLLLARPEGFERHYLMGNHEQAMLAFMKDPVAGRAWLLHGGLETLASYGVQPLPTIGAETAELVRAGASLKERLPSPHLAFLSNLERYVVRGDYLFVHAGIDPDRPLAEQTERELFWIRDRFLRATKQLQYKVVHGHTPSTAPYADHRRVGVDTGAYMSGVLTAARFEGDAVEFVAIRDN